MRASSTQWNRPKKLDKGASTTLPARLHGRGPVPSPVVVHSYGVSDDPGGIRSSSGSAALRRAATPPWTPAFSSRRPLLRSVRRPRGDPQLIRLRCAPPGCYSPLDPRLLQSSSTPTECPTPHGGSAPP